MFSQENKNVQEIPKFPRALVEKTIQTTFLALQNIHMSSTFE